MRNNNIITTTVHAGFTLIISAWKEQVWMQPTLVEQAELSQVKLVLATDGVLCPSEGTKCPSDVPQNVPPCPSDDYQNVTHPPRGQECPSVEAKCPSDVPPAVWTKLSKRQQNILQLMIDTPNINREEMSHKVKVSSKTISREIDGMRKLLGIRYEGLFSDGCWVISELKKKEE